MPKVMITQQETTVFLGLGGNLGDPLAAFRRSRQKLIAHPAISDCHSSPLYQTPPIGGPADQPDYLNAALMLRTSLDPRALLAFCHSLETEEGRKRKEHWGARTLDIDLLFYAQQQLKEADIEIPHPRLMERHFVLLPLVALAPDYHHPQTGMSMQELLNRLPSAENIRMLTLNW